jgi:hypothetical protein
MLGMRVLSFGLLEVSATTNCARMREVEELAFDVPVLRERDCNHSDPTFRQSGARLMGALSGRIDL